MTKKGWGTGWSRIEEACIYSDLFPDWQVANEIAKPQVSIHSNNSLVDCKNYNRRWKLATGNRK